jgi:hypothetical protein
MKRFFYVLLIAISSSLVITSCTEDEVQPKQETDSSPTGTPNTGKL